MNEWVGQPDEQLLLAARRSSDAYEEFCRRYIVQLHGWLAAETRDPQIAADLTAETLAQALEGAHRFRARVGSSAAPWLFGIAQNLLRRYRRLQRTDSAARLRLGMPESAQAASEFDDAEERLAAEGLRTQLRAALATLSEKEQRAVSLRVLEELSYDEVAGRLGCSPTAARIRVSRGLRALHVRLEGDI